MFRPAFFVALAALGAVAVTAAAEDPVEVRLNDKITVRFASQEAGRAAITRRDTFTAALTRFDLQSRLQTDRVVALDDLLKLQQATART